MTYEVLEKGKWKKRRFKDDEDADLGVEGTSNINLVMSKKLINKLDYLSTEYTDSEVCGFIVRRDKEMVADKSGIITIVLDDLLIPPQEAKTSEVDIDAKGQVDMFNEYGQEVVSRITAHWHSHHTMGTFFSSTDETMMKNYSENRNLCVFVVSSEGKHLIRIVFRNVINNVPIEFAIENVEYEVEGDNSVKEEMDLEISKKVKKPIAVTISYNYYNNRSSSVNKKLKKDIGERIKYLQHQNHKVMVVKLFKLYADLIMEEFKVLNPVIETSEMTKEGQHYNVIIECGTKNKAKEFMVDVKACLYKEAMINIEKNEAKKEVSEEELYEGEIDNTLTGEELREYLDEEELEELDRENLYGYGGGSGRTSWKNYEERENDIIRKKMNGEFMSNRLDYSY